MVGGGDGGLVFFAGGGALADVEAGKREGDADCGGATVAGERAWLGEELAEGAEVRERPHAGVCGRRVGIVEDGVGRGRRRGCEENAEIAWVEKPCDVADGGVRFFEDAVECFEMRNRIAEGVGVFYGKMEWRECVVEAVKLDTAARGGESFEDGDGVCRRAKADIPDDEAVRFFCAFDEAGLADVEFAGLGHGADNGVECFAMSQGAQTHCTRSDGHERKGIQIIRSRHAEGFRT